MHCLCVWADTFINVTELCDVYSVLLPADRVAMVTDDVFLAAVQGESVDL